MSSRISNSRKIPGPKKRELGGNTVCPFKYSRQKLPTLHVRYEEKTIIFLKTYALG